MRLFVIGLGVGMIKNNSEFLLEKEGGGGREGGFKILEFPTSHRRRRMIFDGEVCMTKIDPIHLGS